MIEAIYSDAGCVGPNPSPHAITWAWCHVNAAGERINQGSGIITPRISVRLDGRRMQFLSSNVGEYAALARAIRATPEGWSGTVFCDSRITLGRFFWDWENNGIPDGWVHHALNELVAKRGILFPVLLDGHPTRKQLAAGHGKRGNFVSEHNVWCDKECGRLAKEFRLQNNVGGSSNPVTHKKEQVK